MIIEIDLIKDITDITEYVKGYKTITLVEFEPKPHIFYNGKPFNKTFKITKKNNITRSNRTIVHIKIKLE
jgi:hypothetical protein